MHQWTLEFSKTFDSKFQKLSLVTQKRVYHFLTVKVLTHPTPDRLAKPLQGEWKGLYRFRVGDYRILAKVDKHNLVIISVDIDHRKNVYR